MLKIACVGRTYQWESILSGSFNPFHKRHATIAEHHHRTTNSKVWLELSLTNADKGVVPNIDDRLRSIEAALTPTPVWFEGVMLTSDMPRFYDKSHGIPCNRFLVGTDTVNRIANQQYYDFHWNHVLSTFKANHTKFYVYQRKDIKLTIPDDFRPFCVFIPPEEYLDDGTSSTQIREGTHEGIHCSHPPIRP